MRYDLEDLRLFIAAAETASLTRGAARCHLAPSSASHRLKQLETNLGTALFERHARGLRLTHAGEILLSHARQVFGQIEQINADLAPFAAGVRAHVTLHANTNATNCFLPDDLADYLRRHPQVRVSLKESASPDILRAVAGGEAEIGVVAGVETHSLLTLLPYRRDRLVLIMPPGHPLAGQDCIAFAEVVDAPFVMLHAGSALHGFMTDIAANLNARLDIRIQVRSFEAMLRMVAAGAGLGLLPRASIGEARHASVAIAELADPWARRDLQVCVRDLRTLSTHAKALVDLLCARENPEPPAP